MTPRPSSRRSELAPGTSQTSCRAEGPASGRTERSTTARLVGEAAERPASRSTTARLGGQAAERPASGRTERSTTARLGGEAAERTASGRAERSTTSRLGGPLAQGAEPTSRLEAASGRRDRLAAADRAARPVSSRTAELLGSAMSAPALVAAAVESPAAQSSSAPLTRRVSIARGLQAAGAAGAALLLAATAGLLLCDRVEPARGGATSARDGRGAASVAAGATPDPALDGAAVHTRAGAPTLLSSAAPAAAETAGTVPLPTTPAVTAPGGAPGTAGGAAPAGASPAAAPAADPAHVAHTAARVMAALELALAHDPAVLGQALSHLRDAASRQDVEVLSAVLGRVRSPAVEAAAAAIARDAAEPWRRAAALDVLDGQDAAGALPVALAALAADADPAVRRAAVHAVPPPAGIEAGAARSTVAALGRAVAGDADPEVRRRAAVALGDWGRSAADLEPVLAALAGDPSVDVRAGAAFGLELARVGDPRVQAALVAALDRAGEDPLVRENAWRALGGCGPLEGPAHRAWVAYGATRAK